MLSWLSSERTIGRSGTHRPTFAAQSGKILPLGSDEGLKGDFMQFLNPSDKTAATDYGSALAGAVAWLGNRYLLASPARRLTHHDRFTANHTAAPSIPSRSRIR
jgi:hypothetical protein